METEVCEWLESVVEDLIEEYKWEEDGTTIDWRNGAIEALEKVLEILKED